MKLFSTWNEETKKFIAIIQISTNYDDSPYAHEMERIEEILKDPKFKIIKIESADGKIIHGEAGKPVE